MVSMITFFEMHCTFVHHSCVAVNSCLLVITRLLLDMLSPISHWGIYPNLSQQLLVKHRDILDDILGDAHTYEQELH